MQKLFICTDLDRTLLPNGKQAESPEARSIFARLVGRPEVRLAYVSGRNLSLVQEVIQEYSLPSPDFIVGDVGSTIYHFNGGIWQYYQNWSQEIAADWQGLNSIDLQPLFTDIVDIYHLTLQEADKQNRFKLSYYLPLGLNDQALQDCMNLRLQEQNIAASLIYSVDEAKGVGLLDILPARATKFHAVEFLRCQLGFDYNDTVLRETAAMTYPCW